MMPARPNRLRGFTLLELLIVIGIIALLAGIGFVAFGAIRESQDKRNTGAVMEVARSMFNAFVNSARSGGNSLTVDATGASTTFYTKLAPPVWAFNSVTYAANDVPEKINFREKKVDTTAFFPDYEKFIDFYNVPRRKDDKPTGILVPMNVPTELAGDDAALAANLANGQFDGKSWQLYATMLTIRRMRSSPEGKAVWSTLRDSQIKHVGAPSSGQDFIMDAWGHPLLFVPGSGVRGLRFGTGEVDSTKPVPWVNGDPSSTPLEQQGFRGPDGHGFWMSAGPDGYYDTQDDNLYSFNN